MALSLTYGGTSLDDMKSLIQEWFADQLSPVLIAELYAELLCEIKRQLEFCMNSTVDNMIEDAKVSEEVE